MYRYTKVHFTKRADFYDVTLYYSKDGQKLRSSTGVRVLHKHLTSKGAISTAHPNLEEDLRTIQTQQRHIEDLVANYCEENDEKPSVTWLEKQLGKSKASTPERTKATVSAPSKVSLPEPKTVVMDSPKILIQDSPKVVEPDRPKVVEVAGERREGFLCFWTDFIEEKKLVLRNEGSVKRYNNLCVMLEAFEGKNGVSISFDSFNQEFFNGFLSYMVNDYEFVRNKHLKNKLELYKPPRWPC